MRRRAVSEAYDPHELLGVSPGASEDEIRKAFQLKAKEVHPDISNAPDATKQFIRLKESYDLLIERSANGASPRVGEDRYRPARDVSEKEREDIIRAHRRKREAEERRRSRRRSSPGERARRSQKQNDAFQEEMARRRAEYEAKQEEERQRREREAQERVQRLRREQEERERLQRERELREQEERERAQHEQEQRRQRERVQREQEERERRRRERQQAQRPVANERSSREDALPECAWKGCRETDDLAIPTRTELGSRRFCKRHHNEYMRRFKTAQRG